ncbi:hypothetical protein E2C01_083880 [Portunus trituberculatus]|uniref:Uncharacterized protein n=1 Tax=Portunus trituberculatus TaxID=210409 RepID=A0A5B7J977_PORTR|nr:hypothetical protein [Portunus trituberculatus]
MSPPPGLTRLTKGILQTSRRR